MTGELAEPVATVSGLAQLGTSGRTAREKAGRAPTGRKDGATPHAPEGQNETPGQLSFAGGFNVTNLAETVGFEPTEECKPLSTLAGWCTRPNYATSPVFACNHTHSDSRLPNWGRQRSGNAGGDTPSSSDY
jgi:hypothetical protein